MTPRIFSCRLTLLALSAVFASESGARAETGQAVEAIVTGQDETTVSAPSDPIVTAADTLPALPVTPSADSERPYELDGLRRDVKAAKWPLIGLMTAISATRVSDLINHPQGFRVRHEGWFGRKTQSLGMDKLHHGFKTYVMADVLQGIIAKKTGDKQAAAYSGALMGLGLMTYGELFDGFSKGHGWSNEDMTIHVAGAGFALLRNAVPGMREKLDFRMEMRPSLRNDAFELVNQLDDRKYLFALQMSGFKRLRTGPLRYAEIHLGYYGRGFTETERLRGDPLKRKVFVGVGLNVQELIFGRKPRSRVEKIARGALDYIQIPYTSVEVN